MQSLMHLRSLIFFYLHTIIGQSSFQICTGGQNLKLLLEMPQYVAYRKNVLYAFIKLSAKSHRFNIYCAQWMGLAALLAWAFPPRLDYHNDQCVSALTLIKQTIVCTSYPLNIRPWLTSLARDIKYVALLKLTL